MFSTFRRQWQKTIGSFFSHTQKLPVQGFFLDSAVASLLFWGIKTGNPRNGSCISSCPVFNHMLVSAMRDLSCLQSIYLSILLQQCVSLINYVLNNKIAGTLKSVPKFGWNSFVCWYTQGKIQRSFLVIH